jgi:hypothetical protein
MHFGERLFSRFKRVIYSVAALALVLISIAMIAAAGLDILSSLEAGRALKQSLLDGIGLVVVSLAVFDVAKYLMEEEVLRDRELRSAAEARETLTKFMVVIVIALTLEALVFVLGAPSRDLSLLVFPAVLFGVAAVMVVALGVYLRLSSQLEARLENDPNIPEGSRQSVSR